MDSSVIEAYCRKSGDTKMPDGNIEENKNGFCVWRAEGKSFIGVAVFGNGAYWNNWCTEKARELKLNTIIMATKRKPGAYVRKYGFKVTGYILARSI